ncbi:MAG TPA: A-macroglobulin complement component, partial [Candidatus Melainabacteria bacterium]|nr:A-macroglobulin complement component [Candidatus Melainabacteria bacterium]
LKLPDIGNVLKAGKHKITLTMEGGAPMPFSLVANYNTPTPVSSDKCKVSIDVKLAETKVAEGATVDATVILANLSKDSVPSPLAIVGIPGGLEPRYDQLKELVKKETIDAYEVKGRELVLYWRGLQAGEKVVVPINLVAAVPGTYKGTASRAYLYYGDENKRWLDGLDIEIIPKKVEIASGLNSESSK